MTWQALNLLSQRHFFSKGFAAMPHAAHRAYRAQVATRPRNDSTIVWGLLAAILALFAVALYQAEKGPSLEDSNHWPTAAPAKPTGDSFQTFDDGRPAPGEAIIGLNEINYKPEPAPIYRAANDCPTCPQTAPAYYVQPEAYKLPSGYVANNAQPVYYQPSPVYYQQSQPVYYSQPVYSSGDCDCENCDCSGYYGRRPLFPIARRAGGLLLRGTARVISAPFRWRRRALENW